MLGRVAVLGTALVCALLAAASAQSSRPVVGDAHVLSLSVNDRGEALFVYRSVALTRHVLAWGTTELRLDYSGGWRRYHRQYWRGFTKTCARYDGPRLSYAVAACTAPDGSYWAMQNVPHRGVEISHWQGPLAKVQTGTAWAYDGRFQVVFGRVTYAGRPAGGRPVLLDAFRQSWIRESPFDTHPRTGTFCYGFYPGGEGTGARYRLAVSGTGGSPLVAAKIPRGHAFDGSKSADVARQGHAAARLRSWGVRTADKDCGPVLRMAAKLKGER